MVRSEDSGVGPRKMYLGDSWMEGRGRESGRALRQVLWELCRNREGKGLGKLLGSESLRAVDLPVRSWEQKLLAGLKVM